MTPRPWAQNAGVNEEAATLGGFRPAPEGWEPLSNSTPEEPKYAALAKEVSPVQLLQLQFQNADANGQSVSETAAGRGKPPFFPARSNQKPFHLCKNPNCEGTEHWVLVSS